MIDLARVVGVVPDHVGDDPPRLSWLSLRRTARYAELGIIQFREVTSQAAMTALRHFGPWELQNTGFIILMQRKRVFRSWYTTIRRVN